MSIFKVTQHGASINIGDRVVAKREDSEGSREEQADKVKELILDTDPGVHGILVVMPEPGVVSVRIITTTTALIKYYNDKGAFDELKKEAKEKSSGK